jgi:Mor family transcriptional regulator
VDWNVIKAEYIAGGTSYRKLAKKYDVSLTTLQRIASKENWIGLRQQAEIKTETKIVEKVSSAKSKTNIKINEVADKLINKMNATIDKLDVIDGQTLKHFTSALKDLKDITGLKSDADLREQEARIRKLEKEAEAEEKDNTIEVVISNNLEEYSK